MKVLELLNGIANQLPFHQANGSDFRENLIKLQESFLDKCKLIDENDLKQFFPENDKSLTKRKLLFRLKKTIHSINQIIDHYYKGYPDEAYKELNILLKNVSYISNLSDAYEGFLLLRDLRKVENVDYFRMREIKPKETKKPVAKDLFHAPFEIRGKVSTSRFSIPGFPCLYLGSSLEVCYAEVNPKEWVFASRFQINTTLFHLQPLDLTVPKPFDETIYNKASENNYDAFAFLLTYPLIQASLIKIKDKCENDNFKPEYIIPQLLVQFVRKEKYFNCVLYSSTKISTNNSSELYHNLVIPVRNIADTGYCSYLEQKIKVTEPLQIYEFHKEKLMEAENILKNYPAINI